MADKTLAHVLFSFLDYRVVYREPTFDLKLHAETMLAVFRALRQWNISLENVTHKQNPANSGEVSTNFSLFSGKFVFSIGLGSSGLLVANPNWSEAGQIARIAEAGVKAVQTAVGVVIDKQQAIISMHLKPVAGAIRDFTSDLVRPNLNELPGADVRAYGISIYGKDSSWVVDASASYPDAIFVRIQRSLAPDVGLEQIAAQLKDDESRLLDLLRLEVE